MAAFGSCFHSSSPLTCPTATMPPEQSSAVTWAEATSVECGTHVAWLCWTRRCQMTILKPDQAMSCPVSSCMCYPAMLGSTYTKTHQSSGLIPCHALHLIV
jgi:hypothetical protein